MELKHKDHIRVGVINARTFPFEGQTPEKYDALRDHVISSDFDVLGIGEINKNWTNIQESNQLRQTAKKWWKNSSTKCSWLRDPTNTDECQTGGNALVTVNTITSYIKARGEDIRKMGRWAWYTISGQQNQMTTIITTYRPCDSSVRKSKSVKMQQHTIIREKFPHITKGPLQLYDDDLELLIQSKIDNGHQLIVMGDFNQDIMAQGSKSSTAKMLIRLGLSETITERHGKAAPATHIYGKHPIDGIFTTRHIQPIKCGYLPGNIHVSDHRTLWIDIDKRNILGERHYTPQQPKYRKLHSSNPRIKRKFNKIMEEQLQNCKVLRKLQKLRSDIRHKGWHEDTMAPCYEICDNLRFRAIQCADNRCEGTKGGGVTFSDSIKQAMGRVTMWKLIYQRATKHGSYRPRRRLLVRKAHKWKFQGNIDEANIKTIQSQFTEARKEYRMIRKNSKQLRQEYLTDKAIALAEESGKPYQGYLKQLIKREEIRTSFRNIKGAQGKYENLNITAVEQGPDEGPRTRIEDKHQMEEAIERANTEKLQQADNTPLREEPLKSLIDETHLNYERWERIVSGEFEIPPNLDEGTTLWFQKMQDPTSRITEVPIAINTASYTDSWRQMKELTSSAPGLHFGHFKAISDTTPIAAEVHTLLAEIPIITGYAPQRWRKCTDAMLRKKANDIRPEKLRLVTLMAADFNHNNKLIGKHIMWNGEKHHRFATEQFGSRKNCSAALHALNKVLTLDCSKQKKEACVVIANDAVSCYDRIVLAAAYCSMLRFGIPAEAAQSMISTIGLLAHSIRTAHGDSTIQYGGLAWIRLPHGICQGNGAGPAIWACVSSPLFEILREEGYGVQHTSPISGVLFNLAGFAFVDDADLIQSMQNQSESSEQLVKKAQSGLKLWEELLRTTGGAIDPKKSDWAMLHFKWHHGKSSIAKGKTKYNLNVRNKSGLVQPLKQLAPSTARETLGCWIALDGNKKKQRKILVGKAKRWGQRLQVSHLNRYDAMLGFRTTIMMSLKYPLLSTSLDKYECAAIMSPLLTRALPRMGMCSRIRRLVLHIPKAMGGLGIPDLWTLQGMDHIKAILDHGGTGSATGTLLQNSLENHILHMGTSHDICRLPRPMYKYMEDTWLKHTFMFMNTNKIYIKHTLPKLHAWEPDDIYLMDKILPKQGNTSTRLEIEAFNRCRLFLKVVTVSDITDQYGNLTSSAWHVHNGYQSISGISYPWPIQKRPHINDIQIWQRTLQTVFKLHPEQHDDQDEKSYTYEATKTAKWWWDPMSNLIWEKGRTKWNKWQPLTSWNKDTPMYQKTPDTKTISRRRWKIATVRTIGISHIMMLAHRKFQPPPSLDHITSTSPPWHTSNMQYDCAGMDTLINEIKSGTAKVVSDGSYKQGCSASAFRHISHNTPGYTGFNHVPGDAIAQNSYRSELGGLMGNVATINQICQKHNIRYGKVTIGCDNTSALNNAFGEHQINTNIPSRDLVAAIRHMINQSTVQWEPKHVKGHQNRKNNTFLDEWALGNIQVDTDANIAREAMNEIPADTHLPGEMWSLEIQDRKVVSNITEELYNQCYFPQAYQYWAQRGRIQPNSQHRIDWTALNKATKMIPESRLIYLAKTYAGYAATGKVMFRRKVWPKNACPRCGLPEDHQHVIQCNHEHAKDEFYQRWGELDDWVVKTSSNDMSSAICTILTDYRDNNKTQNIFVSWSPAIQNAVKDQHRIGHRSFIEGMLSVQWTVAQQEHLQLIGDTRHDANRWVATLTTKLWNLSHHMWEHRNKILHNNENAQKTIYADAQSTKLRNLYSQKSQTMPAMDLQLFQRPLEEALQLPIIVQRRLIRQLTAVVAAHTERKALPQAQALSAWLSTTTPA